MNASIPVPGRCPRDQPILFPAVRRANQTSTTMNELTLTETPAVTGGMTIENLPSLAPSPNLLEALASIALRQEQASLRLLQQLSD